MLQVHDQNVMKCLLTRFSPRTSLEQAGPGRLLSPARIMKLLAGRRGEGRGGEGRELSRSAEKIPQENLL